MVSKNVTFRGNDSGVPLSYWTGHGAPLLFRPASGEASSPHLFTEAPEIEQEIPGALDRKKPETLCPATGSKEYRPVPARVGGASDEQGD